MVLRSPKTELETRFDFKYQKFNPRRGFPFAPNHYYECMLCGYVVASAPEHAIACECGNICIDADAGRCAIDEPDKARYLKLFPKRSTGSESTA